MTGQTVSGGAGFKSGTKLDESMMSELSLEKLLDIQPAEEEIFERLTQIGEHFKVKQQEIDDRFEDKNANYKQAMIWHTACKNCQGISGSQTPYPAWR